MGAQQKQAERAVSVTPQGLTYDRIKRAKIKFTLGSMREVLPNIKPTVQTAKATFVSANVRAAEKEDLPEYKFEQDSVRPGKTDLGMPVINEIDIGVSSLLAGFMGLGYGLVSSGYYEKKGRKTVPVVEFQLVLGASNATNVDELMAQYDHYAADMYGRVDVWDNPSLEPTFNCHNRKRGVRPRRKIVAGKKSVYVI